MVDTALPRRSSATVGSHDSLHTRPTLPQEEQVSRVDRSRLSDVLKFARMCGNDLAVSLCLSAPKMQPPESIVQPRHHVEPPLPGSELARRIETENELNRSHAGNHR